MKMAGGIPKNDHDRFHYHLAVKYGKASMCESPDCEGKPTKRYEWCLKKGHSYSMNREDYLQMCTSCHRKYDFNEKIRERLKAKKLGELHNTAKLNNSQVIEIVNLINKGLQNKEIAPLFNVSTTAICNIRTGKRWGYLTGITYKSKRDEK